jgi:hypothetical protein
MTLEVQVTRVPHAQVQERGTILIFGGIGPTIAVYSFPVNESLISRDIHPKIAEWSTTQIASKYACIYIICVCQAEI